MRESVNEMSSVDKVATTKAETYSLFGGVDPTEAVFSVSHKLVMDS